MTNELALLAAARPLGRAAADDTLSAEQRHAILAGIKATHSQPLGEGLHKIRASTIKRRLATSAGAVLVAATIAFVTGAVSLPAGLSDATEANATIEQLAVAAGSAPADLVRPGEYRHIVTLLTSGTDKATADTWIANDGHSWRRDDFVGPEEYHAFTPSEGVDFAGASPSFLATLPTQPSALRDYLRKHVSGSATKDAAVFVAVGDMLRTGITPPALRAAALRVLATMHGVKTSSSHDALDRIAVAISYKTSSQDAALLVDPATGTLLEERQGPQFTMTYTSDIAVAVPAEVLAKTGTTTGTTSTDSGAVTSTATEPAN